MQQRQNPAGRETSEQVQQLANVITEESYRTLMWTDHLHCPSSSHLRHTQASINCGESTEEVAEGAEAELSAPVRRVGMMPGSENRSLTL